MVVLHAVMLAAMLAAMLLRHDEYSAGTGRTATRGKNAASS